MPAFVMSGSKEEPDLQVCKVSQNQKMRFEYAGICDVRFNSGTWPTSMSKDEKKKMELS